MKTWKKIEETKKRTNDISGLKKRNEEKVQKVSTKQLFNLFLQKIFDIQLDNEQKRQMSQNNYMMSKQRYDEKKKVQDALMLQKKEEAK